MPNSKSKNYKDFVNAISRFQNEDLKLKLTNYFKNELEEYGRDDLRERYTNDFCRLLKSINNLDIEFYLEYCLDYFEIDFMQFLRITSFVCGDVNQILKSIEENYLRYCGKGELEKTKQTIGNIDFNIHREWSAKYDDNFDMELIDSLKSIIEIERQLIQDFYDGARNGQKVKKSLLQ